VLSVNRDGARRSGQEKKRVSEGEAVREANGKGIRNSVLVVCHEKGGLGKFEEVVEWRKKKGEGEARRAWLLSMVYPSGAGGGGNAKKATPPQRGLRG